MNPEARCCSKPVIAGFVEAFGEEAIGKISSLGKALDNFAHFEIDLVTSGCVSKVVFLEKFNTRIFLEVERGVHIEVANVKTGKACMTAICDAIENKFCEFE